MLRLIFTALATLALICTGALWLAAQPSGSGVREVVAPVLNRGFEMVGAAGKRAVTSASRDLLAAEDDDSRVALTPTASGVWEPELAEAAPARPSEARSAAAVPESAGDSGAPPVPLKAPRSKASEPEAPPRLAGGGEDAPPEEIALAPDETALIPEEIALIPEEIALVPPSLRPFREATLEELENAEPAGSGGNGPAAEPAGLNPDVTAQGFDPEAAPPPDQDDWAALIRRMLVVHSRVRSSE